MARMKKTGKAIQLAPQLYVVGSQLDTKDVVRIHFYEIAASFWPDGVFVGKSALSPNLKDNNEFLYPIQTRHDLPRSFLRASRSFRCLEYVRIGGSEKIKRP